MSERITTYNVCYSIHIHTYAPVCTLMYSIILPLRSLISELSYIHVHTHVYVHCLCACVPAVSYIPSVHTACHPPCAGSQAGTV